MTTDGFKSPKALLVEFAVAIEATENASEDMAQAKLLVEKIEHFAGKECVSNARGDVGMSAVAVPPSSAWRPLVAPERSLLPVNVESRVKVLRVIAERYHELVSPAGGNGEKGSGEYAALMPSTYTATVREFEHLMGVMRYDRHRPLVKLGQEGVSLRKLRWHVAEWFVEARMVQRPAMLHRAKDGGWQPLLDKHGWPLDKVPFGEAVMREKEGHPSKAPVMCHLRLPDARKDLAEAGLRWMSQAWDPDKLLSHNPPVRLGEPLEPVTSVEKKPAVVAQVDALDVINRRTRQAIRDNRAA